MKELNGRSMITGSFSPDDVSSISDNDRKAGVEGRFHPQQFVWGVILLGLAAGLFIPAFLLTFGGLIVYLWIIPLAAVPVIVFQILAICIAGTFALTLSKTVIDIVRRRSLKTEEEQLSLTGHLLRTAVFIMAFFGSPLYFLNVISLVLGTILLWKSKHKIWQGLGFVVIVWVMLVQFYIFTSLWN
jgi:hypothetical protein